MGAPRITMLRPGAIYGPHPQVRESIFVDQIAKREATLPLPDGFWACNVVDPYDWDYSGLAAQVAELLDWQWEPRRVEFSDTDHPWQTSHPVLVSDRRLREQLRVTEPDPKEALAETVRFLCGAMSD